MTKPRHAFARRWSAVFVACLAMLICLAGCGGGDSGSGGGGTEGYTVRITVLQALVPTGGQTTFFVTVSTKDGPVADGELVTFTSLLGGSFTDLAGNKTSSIAIADGKATAFYTAPATAGNDKITALYKGAYSFIWITVYAK